MATKKQLSKGEITQYAQDFLEALKSSDHLTKFSQRFSAESASTRRDVLEGVCERIKKIQMTQFDSDKVVLLLEPALVIGSGQKLEFSEKYYRTLFACAAGLSDENGDLSCKLLFMRLVAMSGENSSGVDARLVMRSTMAALADAHDVVRGLGSALLDESLHQALNGAFEIWSVMIPELAAKGVNRIGLPIAARSGFLKIIAGRQKLDSSIRLSLPVIVGSVGAIPKEFHESQHAKSDLVIRESLLSAGGGRLESVSGGPSLATELAVAPPTAMFSSKDISKLSDGIQALLRELDAGIGDRIKNLGDEIQRTQKNLADVNKELVERNERISSMDTQKSRLLEEIGQHRIESAALAKELSDTREELNRYVQSHDALAKSSGNIERDIADRMKREFAEHAGAVLGDIRNYLDNLQKTPDVETVRLAVSCFNRLAKILQNKNFLTVSILPKIEGLEQPRVNA